MVQIHKRKRAIRHMSMFIMAVILPLTGISFGQERIEKESKLAKQIERRRKIVIVMSGGEKIVPRPAILEEGIAMRPEEWQRAGSYQPTLIPWDDIREIKVRRTGAGLGGLIGGGGGAVLGGVLAEYLSCREDVCPAPAGSLAGAIIIGGAAGALIGYLIGSLHSHWKIIYSAHALEPPVPSISLRPTRGGATPLMEAKDKPVTLCLNAGVMLNGFVVAGELVFGIQADVRLGKFLMVCPEFNIWTNDFRFRNLTYVPGATLNITLGRFFVGGGGVAMKGGDYGGFGIGGESEWVLRYKLNLGYRTRHFKAALAGIPFNQLEGGVAGVLTLGYGF